MVATRPPHPTLGVARPVGHTVRRHRARRPGAPAPRRVVRWHGPREWDGRVVVDAGAGPAGVDRGRRRAPRRAPGPPRRQARVAASPPPARRLRAARRAGRRPRGRGQHRAERLRRVAVLRAGPPGVRGRPLHAQRRGHRRLGAGHPCVPRHHPGGRSPAGSLLGQGAGLHRQLGGVRPAAVLLGHGGRRRGPPGDRPRRQRVARRPAGRRPLGGAEHVVAVPPRPGVRGRACRVPGRVDDRAARPRPPAAVHVRHAARPRHPGGGVRRPRHAALPAARVAVVDPGPRRPRRSRGSRAPTSPSSWDWASRCSRSSPGRGSGEGVREPDARRRPPARHVPRAPVRAIVAGVVLAAARWCSPSPGCWWSG